MKRLSVSDFIEQKPLNSQHSPRLVLDMTKWHLFGRKEEPSPDPSTRAKLEAKLQELQRARGIDDNALRALSRRLQTEVDMIENLRDLGR